MADIQISDRTDLTLDEAKAEYRELLALKNVKVFPQGGMGWSAYVLRRIEDRLNFLRTRITDIICEVAK